MIHVSYGIRPQGGHTAASSSCTATGFVPARRLAEDAAAGRGERLGLGGGDRRHVGERQDLGVGVLQRGSGLDAFVDRAEARTRSLPAGDGRGGVARRSPSPRRLRGRCRRAVSREPVRGSRPPGRGMPGTCSGRRVPSIPGCPGARRRAGPRRRPRGACGLRAPRRTGMSSGPTARARRRAARPAVSHGPRRSRPVSASEGCIAGRSVSTSKGSASMSRCWARVASGTFHRTRCVHQPDLHPWRSLRSWQCCAARAPSAQPPHRPRG